LTPGYAGLSGFSKQGPYGKSYLVKVVEIISIYYDLVLRNILQMYCNQYKSFCKYSSLDENYPFITNLTELFDYLGHGFISRFHSSLKKEGVGSLKNMIVNGTRFRLATFPDGAGKIRYIAISS
jgi:hypothetical protein